MTKNDIIKTVLTAGLSALFVAVSAYVLVRVEIASLRSDVKHLDENLDRIESDFRDLRKEATETARRLSTLEGRMSGLVVVPVPQKIVEYVASLDKDNLPQKIADFRVRL